MGGGMCVTVVRPVPSPGPAALTGLLVPGVGVLARGALLPVPWCPAPSGAALAGGPSLVGGGALA